MSKPLSEDDEYAGMTPGRYSVAPAAEEELVCKSSEKLCPAMGDDLQVTATTAGPPNSLDNETGEPQLLQPTMNRYLAVLVEFCTFTSAHGWGRVAKSPRAGAKLLWAVITVCALVLMSIHVSALAVLYLQFSSEYKLRTAVKVVEFPSVTVCNLLPMSPSTKKTLLMDESSQISQWERVLAAMDRFDGVAETLGKAEEYEIIKMRLQEPSGYFDNIGDESLIVGHQLRDFILGCTVGTDSCDLFYNFSLFQTRDFFNCYTFSNEENVLLAKVTGPAAGLSLVLYLENDNGEQLAKETYHPMWNLGNSAGVRVVIHAPRSQPNPAEEGFNVPPGNSANVALGVRSYGRLNSPYGDCIEDSDETTALSDGGGEEEGGGKFAYSMSACLSVCRQLYIVKKCHCLSSLLPIPATLSNLDLNLTYCAKWDVHNASDLVHFFNRVDCESKSTEEFAINEQQFQITCRCYPLCEENEYPSKFSYSYWPVEYTQESFYETYVLENPGFWNLKAYENLKQFNTTQMIEKGLISDNFVRVNIYLQSSVIEEYSQKASHSPANFVSAIGGTFGLWIGMSVITWCEVVQLICKIVFMKIVESVKRIRQWRSEETITKETATITSQPLDEDQDKQNKTN